MTATLAPETETVTNERTFRVDETNLDRARDLVAKVNKRAARYGLGQYELVIGDLELVPVTAPDGLFGQLEGRVKVIGYRGVYTVELVGEQPRIDGWSFVATLDYEEVETAGDGRVVTRVVPGVDVDLAAHRPRPAECDACGKHRARNNTYVLRHADGRTMQVGSNCIAPYMGLDVRGLGWLAGDPLAELSELNEEREESGSWGGNRDRRYDVDAVLLATMMAEQVHGWVSRTAAQASESTATSVWVRLILDGPRTDRDREDLARIADRADVAAAEAKAAKVKTWAATQDDASEWATNVRIAATGTTVSSRNLGVLASAVAGYNRAEGLRVEREQTVPAEWIGEPKQRIQITGKVVRTTTIDGFYGTSELVLIRTETALIKWFSSRVTEFEAGQTVTGKVTIKGHETYNGDKQTSVARCALEIVPA